ncbi:MAG: tetratricopeptide repeat protein [Desulfatiglandaceae bacterium]
MTALLIVGGLASGWWVWQYTSTHPHRLDYILISISGEPRKVLSGETVHLHPDDRVKILKISTSIPLNMGIRLVTADIDINALRYDSMTLHALLPQQDPFERYTFPIEVKHNNQVIGDVTWIVQPFVEDWLEKANRIIDDEKRLALLERAVRRHPADERLQRRLLEEYKAQKKLKKAAGVLVDLAERETSYDILTELLDIYRRLHNPDGIIAVLRRLLKLNPNDLKTRKALAEALTEEGEWRQAIDEYQALLKQTEPQDSLYIHKHLGYLYTQLGDVKQAIAAYRHAAKLDQKDANIHYNLSYLYEQIGEKEKSDFYLSNAVTLKSDDIESRLKLAESLVEKEKYPRAKKHLSAVLKKQPDSVEALVLMARILENQGDKDALKKTYRKLLSVNPENETLVYNLGVLEYETGNLTAAREHCSQYVKSHPDDPTAHGILFDIYQQQNQPEHAFEEAKTLVRLRPEDPGPYPFIFDYLQEKGRYQQVIPIMKKGLETNPDALDLREYLLEAYIETGNTDGAIIEARKLLEARAPDVLPLMQALFTYLHKKDDYSSIISIMKKGAEQYPNILFFRECLILAYLKTDQENQAITEMEALLKARPKDVKLRLQLAGLKEKKGDLTGAATAYKQVLELDPDHQEASEAYLRLRLEGVKKEE